MATNDYCVVVYKILNYMYECMKTNINVSGCILENNGVLVPKLNEKYWKLITRNLTENGYIEIDKTTFYARDLCDKTVPYAEIHTYNITTKGIEYMYKNLGYIQRCHHAK